MLEVQRPRQLEPELTSQRSPGRQFQSTPERKRYDVMDTDNISPWRRNMRHRPYAPRTLSTVSGPIRGHSGSLKSLPVAASEPIYAEPSFPADDERRSDVGSPQVKHYDYGWVDGHDKENIRAITEIPDRYFATTEELADDDYCAQAIHNHYSSHPNRLQDCNRFESGGGSSHTLPRNVAFKTCSRTKIATHASSVKSLPQRDVTDAYSCSSSTKDYGWIDLAPPRSATDHASQSSGYSSATVPPPSGPQHKLKLVTNV